ncbi:uncharacterized protein LOC114531262 [Dendronephthya gigantea]|uniref:uncharacterized protein LOC114531262 n=1 Tax=Dendronephthya gigantea TaxID=151771 RepID=UPI00106D0CFD|nr:uncharacterized protein LOC114531262 [Dendronephthya gigantea]
MDPTLIEFPKGFMDDNGNEVNGENKPNGSQTPYYNVKSQGHTYVGDGTTVNISKDKRKTTNVVNVYNVNIVQPNTDDKEGLPADCTVRQLTGVSEEEKKPNDVK